MKVASLVHFYVPYRRAGSETMLHTLNKALLGAGHEVIVTSTTMQDAPRAFEFEGVPVLNDNLFLAVQNIRQLKPDVILTHHDNALKGVSLARKMGCRSAFMVHNSFSINHNILNAQPDLTIFNTHWIIKDMGYRGPSTVFHPPVWAEEHKTTPGNKITLVNLNEHKGALILYELAERMPHLEFLGVVGGHGDQIIRHDLPNVEIQEQTSDMKNDVWAKTRILLMPSIYESYGMVGVEALASGIPVLANGTPGLLESLGDAGTFINRSNINGYQATIEQFRRQDVWDSVSAKCLARSAQLDPAPELTAVVKQLEILGGA